MFVSRCVPCRQVRVVCVSIAPFSDCREPRHGTAVLWAPQRGIRVREATCDGELAQVRYEPIGVSSGCGWLRGFRSRVSAYIVDGSRRLGRYTHCECVRSIAPSCAIGDDKASEMISKMNSFLSEEIRVDSRINQSMSTEITCY